MAFWGVEVKPGRPFKLWPYSRTGRLHVSKAVLGIGSSMNKSIVQCYLGKKIGSVFICCLVPDRYESSELNLEFEEVDSVLFSVIGTRSVHLSGFYINNSLLSSISPSSSSPPNKNKNKNKREESYGEDIGDSDSEYYRSQDDDDDEDDDDSFIVPDSPCGAKEEAEEEKSPVNKKRKRVDEGGVSDDSNNKNIAKVVMVVSDNKEAVAVVDNATTKKPTHIRASVVVEKYSSNQKKTNEGGDGGKEEEEEARSITLPNGLLIEDIQLGNTDEKVAALGKKISVNFTCKIKGNEQVVNSNLAGKPLKFHLGSEKTMGGWEDGIVGMRVGGKRRLIVPPLLWKGKGDDCEKIRSKASLVYEIHLLRVSG